MEEGPRGRPLADQPDEARNEHYRQQTQQDDEKPDLLLMEGRTALVSLVGFAV
jgi:hypothetical protein